jgi:hypothetical protein
MLLYQVLCKKIINFKSEKLKNSLKFVCPDYYLVKSIAKKIKMTDSGLGWAVLVVAGAHLVPIQTKLFQHTPEEKTTF